MAENDENGEIDIIDLLNIENQMVKVIYKNECEMMKMTNDKETDN